MENSNSQLFPYMFVNGEILHKDEALIPLYDLGLLRGMGIFDFFPGVGWYSGICGRSHYAFAEFFADD